MIWMHTLAFVDASTNDCDTKWSAATSLVV
jgi:hypothetical protein